MLEHPYRTFSLNLCSNISGNKSNNFFIKDNFLSVLENIHFYTNLDIIIIVHQRKFQQNFRHIPLVPTKPKWYPTLVRKQKEVKGLFMNYAIHLEERRGIWKDDTGGGGSSKRWWMTVTVVYEGTGFNIFRQITLICSTIYIICISDVL